MSPPRESDVANDLLQTIRKSGLLKQGQRILVAVSGGADSVAMLHLLHELSSKNDFSLVVAHYNHGLRGVESDADQAFVEDLAARLDLPAVFGHGTLSLSNVEEEARRQRYSFLRESAESHRCERIATGHTREDQAETVLMRVLRGCGLDGLRGVLAEREDGVIRPLLNISRSELRRYLSAKGVSHREDSSNTNLGFLRNRIRLEVMPLLESINPSVTESLAGLSRRATVEMTAFDEVIDSTLRNALRDEGSLSLDEMRSLGKASWLPMIRRWLGDRRGNLIRIESSHLDAIFDLAVGQKPNGEIDLPGGQRVRRRYDRLLFDPSVPEGVDQGDRRLPEFAPMWVRARRTSMTAMGSLPRDLWRCACDAEVISGIRLRCARYGDRIQPLGMSGHRKLQDLFVDQKIAPELRWHYPVLEADGEILWVPGLVRSSSALLTDRTRNIWLLQAGSSRGHV